MTAKLNRTREKIWYRMRTTTNKQKLKPNKIELLRMNCATQPHKWSLAIIKTDGKLNFQCAFKNGYLKKKNYCLTKVCARNSEEGKQYEIGEMK